MDECADRARGSPAALAWDLAPLALKRIGTLLEREDTDDRLLVQAAKLALWATQLGGDRDDPEDGRFEIRFTGGADGDA